jgi:DNA repair protein RadC
MSKLKDLPKVERPREKLVSKGVDNLKDEELLAILLGTGTKNKNVLELSKQILKAHPKKKLINITYKELVKHPGINMAKACLILSSIELVKRLMNIKSETLPIIKTKQDIVAQISYLRDKKQEHLVGIYLNARNEMLSKKDLFIGTLNANLVHPREIFLEALNLNATAAIIVHNHPSGNSEPSEEDLIVTKRIIESGKIMGIEILEHVIISKTQSFSFKENKLI